MKELEVYIDGTRLNYANIEGFPLSIAYNISQIENPSALSGSRSKRTATFPADKVNESFFEQWHDTARVNPDAGKRKPARVEVNGIVVFTGTAQLAEVSAIGMQYERTGARYSVTLIGNNATWFADLKEAKVKDLGVIPSHILDPTTVQANDEPNPDTADWGYTLVRTIDWFDEDNVRWIELTPFAFIRAMLKKAFQDIGYTFHSDFFDSEYGKRLIHLFPLRDFPSDWVNANTLYAYDFNNSTPGGGLLTFVHVTILGETFFRNPAGNYNASGYYIVPVSGYYILNVFTDTPQTTRRVRVNNTTILPQFTDPSEINFGVQDRVYLEAGDELDLVVATSLSTVGLQILYIRPDVSGWDEGTEVNLSVFGNKDWLVGDMILGLTHAFALHWTTDPDGYTVRAEPADRWNNKLGNEQDPDTWFLDGFYHNTDREDITGRIDLLKEATIENVTSGIKSNYVLAWKSDGNDANQQDLEESDPDLKTFDALFPFVSDRFEPGTTRIENPYFAKTFHAFEEQIRDLSSSLIPCIPVLQIETYGIAQDERGDFEPRILWFAGRRDGLDGYVKMEDGGGGTFAYDPPQSFMVNYNDEVGLDPNLSFANEDLPLTDSTSSGLMQRFHLQRLKRIESGKKVTEWVTWREIDILNLDFRRKLLIDGTLYLLQELNGHKPQTDDSTETVLLKDEIPVNADRLRIVGSDIIGRVPKIK